MHVCRAYPDVVCGQLGEVVTPRIASQQPRLSLLNFQPAVVGSAAWFVVPPQELDGLSCNDFGASFCLPQHIPARRHTQVCRHAMEVQIKYIISAMGRSTPSALQLWGAEHFCSGDLGVQGPQQSHMSAKAGHRSGPRRNAGPAPQLQYPALHPRACSASCAH